MADITTPEHRELAAKVRQVLGYYAEAEDLINIGAYVKGSNAQIDEAIQYIEPVKAFLKQAAQDSETFAGSLEKLKAIFSTARPSANNARGQR
jgi:flagellum-specific ATP synthase